MPSYDDDFATRLGLAVGVGALALTVVAVLWFGLLPTGGGSGGESEQVASASPESQPVATGGPDTTAADRIEPEDEAEDGRRDNDGSAATEDVDMEVPSTTTGESELTPAPSDPVTPTPSTLAEPSTPSTVAPTPSTVAEPSAANYPTLPDGTPVPVLVIYDGELIALSGAVPSESAAQRLQVLAVANSSVPGAEVASFLTIEPTVPLGVGVRVIEMNSARFPEGSPAISPEHAAQLDRIVAIMTALPHLTVEVIGHSDQRGDDEANFALSTDRARAAADYVSSRGVDPTRLSSRGAGESDLLTLNNDQAALALNRRTEFVLSGLLVDPPEPV